MCELLGRDICRELAVVDRAVGLTEAGGLGEVVCERRDRAIVGRAAELFETTPGELVQAHALAHRHGFEQRVPHHSMGEPVAQRRAGELDEVARLHCRGEDVEQLIVVGVVGHDAQERELELGAGHRGLAQEIGRRGLEARDAVHDELHHSVPAAGPVAGSPVAASSRRIPAAARAT